MSVIPQVIFNQLIAEALSVQNSLGPNENAEAEIRFRGLAVSTTEKQFLRVILELTSAAGEPVVTEDIVELGDGIRKITTRATPSTVHYETKYNNWFHWIHQFQVKVSVSREIKTDPPESFSPVQTRERKRYSFDIAAIHARLDATVVNTIDLSGRKPPIKSFEFELEILDLGRITYKKFANKINLIMQLIHGTTVIYNYEVKKRLLNFYQYSLGGGSKQINAMGRRMHGTDRPHHAHMRPGAGGASQTTAFPRRFEPGLLANARTMKATDCVSGGIVDGKTLYTATVKADGIRRLLVAVQNKICLITPPDQLDVLAVIDDATLHGFVLDGEDVPRANRTNDTEKRTAHLYLAFDCLSTPTDSIEPEYGDPSIQASSHLKRMEQAQLFINTVNKHLPNMLFRGYTKKFLALENPIKFFTRSSELMREARVMGYKTDGLIFTPETAPYLTRTTLPVSKRALTNTNEIVKLKSREQLTTDFLLDVENRRLMSFNRGTFVPFQGSKTNPFDPETQVEWDNDLIAKAADGIVIEMAWKTIAISAADEDAPHVGMYFPERYRPDKPYPNSIEVADDNWTQLHGGIMLEDVIGESNKFVRRYHNRIKNQLFNEAASLTAARTGEPLTLLDIGSGRGGDVFKWRNRFSNILAVEPNGEHIVELNRRIEVAGMQSSVEVLQGGGEDTEAIKTAMKGKKADVVALMLSASFFWSDEEMLQKLADTINENLAEHGIVIYLTIDGNAIDEIITPIFKRGAETTSVSFKTGQTEFLFGDDPTSQQYEVVIPGTIVERQIEYKVRMADLVRRLKNKRFRYSYIADKEKCLPSADLVYTRMYSYGLIDDEHEDGVVITE